LGNFATSLFFTAKEKCEPRLRVLPHRHPIKIVVEGLASLSTTSGVKCSFLVTARIGLLQNPLKALFFFASTYPRVLKRFTNVNECKTTGTGLQLMTIHWYSLE
jgi:hypothetical protein